jgi:hypothetical protein
MLIKPRKGKEQKGEQNGGNGHSQQNTIECRMEVPIS